MNKPLRTTLRLLGLYRETPTTRLGQYLRRMERSLVVLAALYLGLQCFPQVLFAHSVTADGITFYSRQPLPDNLAESCAARSRELLQASELASPERPERVFVCDSPWLFTLFGPTSTRAFAFSVPVTDNVFIAGADFSADAIHSRAPVYNTRALSAVVAHEITHGLIRRRLGWLRAALLPTWVAEGYCDYVAREGSFPEATGLALMAAGREDASPAFRYFEYRQAVRYLLDDQHASFAQLVVRAHDFASVEAETRQRLRDRLKAQGVDGR